MARRKILALLLALYCSWEFLALVDSGDGQHRMVCRSKSRTRSRSRGRGRGRGRTRGRRIERRRRHRSYTPPRHGRYTRDGSRDYKEGATSERKTPPPPDERRPRKRTQGNEGVNKRTRAGETPQTPNSKQFIEENSETYKIGGYTYKAYGVNMTKAAREKIALIERRENEAVTKAREQHGFLPNLGDDEPSKAPIDPIPGTRAAFLSSQLFADVDFDEDPEAEKLRDKLQAYEEQSQQRHWRAYWEDYEFDGKPEPILDLMAAHVKFDPSSRLPRDDND
mmetsp:Transcript_1091/g.2116  ORF Transcript_1091/g.2116 Transcript_1091/m.2116 type:complete len:280 (-) Transcript_1091:90-929(-)